MINKAIDADGLELQVGQPVAFNYSGTVCFGKVKRIRSYKPSPWGYGNKINVDIKHIDRNQTTNVRNANSVHVLTSKILKKLINWKD